jgi:hypothetical protein
VSIFVTSTLRAFFKEALQAAWCPTSVTGGGGEEEGGGERKVEKRWRGEKRGTGEGREREDGFRAFITTGSPIIAFYCWRALIYS